MALWRLQPGTRPFQHRTVVWRPGQGPQQDQALVLSKGGKKARACSTGTQRHAQAAAARAWSPREARCPTWGEWRLPGRHPLCSQVPTHCPSPSLSGQPQALGSASAASREPPFPATPLQCREAGGGAAQGPLLWGLREIRPVSNPLPLKRAGWLGGRTQSGARCCGRGA